MHLRIISFHITLKGYLNHDSDCTSFVQEAQADISSIDQRIRELTNQHNQREIAFLNRHRQSAEMALKARKWADENVDKLQRKVWGPIALEVGSVVGLDYSYCWVDD